jgi:hypothetical protein
MCVHLLVCIVTIEAKVFLHEAIDILNGATVFLIEAINTVGESTHFSNVATKLLSAGKTF